MPRYMDVIKVEMTFEGGKALSAVSEALLRCRRLERNAAPLAGSAVRLHNDLDVLLKHGEHFHQTLGGVVLEVAAQKMGQVRLADAYQLGCFDLGQPTLLDEPVQLRDDVRFQQPLFGIGQVKVSEDVAAAFIGLDFPFWFASSSFAARAVMHFGIAQARPDQLDLVLGGDAFGAAHRAREGFIPPTWDAAV
jgi:hypothetical protein